MTKIIEHVGKIDISDIKRCYADIVIKSSCPVCDSAITANLNESYLSYPQVPSEDSIPFYCDACDEYLDMPIKIKSANLTIEYDLGKIQI
jgi:hypothetical protein